MARVKGADVRDGPRQPVQSVDRAMRLLAGVATSDTPPSLLELATRTQLNRSTAWRLLATLEAHGMVERDARGGYRIGYGALRLGGAADMASVVRRVRPELEALAESVDATVSLAMVRSMSLVYVDHVDHVANDGMAYAPWTGERVGLHSTSSGKAFLAWLSRAERDGALPRELEQFTEATITDREALEAELNEVRTTGYAVCAGEDAAFTNGVSAAALDARRRPVAVVNIWGPERRVPTGRFSVLGPAAVASADRVAGLLA